MSINKIIIVVLDFFCTLLLLLSGTFYILFIILGIMFSGDEVECRKNTTLSFNNIIQGPYYIPATLHVDYRDSTSADILTRHMDTGKQKEMILTNFRNKDYYLMDDTLVNQLVVKKPYPLDYIKNHSSAIKKGNSTSFSGPLPKNYTDDDFLKASRSDAHGETDIKMKSNNLWYNILLSLRSHVLFISGILILYQLAKILGRLRKQVNFSFELFERVRIVAWIYLGHQLILFILSWIYSGWYDSVKLTTSSTIENFEPYMTIYFKPMLEYNWDTIVIGGFAVLFSHLIKLGLEFKEDSELTI